MHTLRSSSFDIMCVCDLNWQRLLVVLSFSSRAECSPAGSSHHEPVVQVSVSEAKILIPKKSLNRRNKTKNQEDESIADYIAFAQAKARNLMCRATRGRCSLRDSQRKSFFA